MQTTFLYRIPPTRHIVGLTLCTALALAVSYFASINREGINGFKALSFSAQEASLIFWAVAVLFAAGAVCCVVMLRRSLEGPVRLALGQENLSAPRASLKGDILSIPYLTIQKVSLHSVQTQQMVVVESSVGQSRVSSLGFASDQEFESFYKGLTAKIDRSPKL
jgi:hypothetical protein